jgi:hypothetical protein
MDSGLIIFSSNHSKGFGKDHEDHENGMSLNLFGQDWRCLQLGWNDQISSVVSSVNSALITAHFTLQLQPVTNLSWHFRFPNSSTVISCIPNRLWVIGIDLTSVTIHVHAMAYNIRTQKPRLCAPITYCKKLVRR